MRYWNSFLVGLLLACAGAGLWRHPPPPVPAANTPALTTAVWQEHGCLLCASHGDCKPLGDARLPSSVSTISFTVPGATMPPAVTVAPFYSTGVTTATGLFLSPQSCQVSRSQGETIAGAQPAARDY